MKQYVRRWQHVETSQWTLKQNLVKYNNFVREKQGKVADGVSFILMEKQKQAKVPNIYAKAYKTLFRYFYLSFNIILHCS